MPVHQSATTQYHRNRRREVLAAAEVNIQQVQVIDKNGKVRALIVWQCGPDILYSDSMDGLFDVQRRKKAPKWVLEQLSALPEDRRFDYLGNPRHATEAPVSAPAAPDYIPAEDDSDLPEFVQG